MLKTILISICLLILFILIIYLIRKTIFGIFVLLAILISFNFLLSYYNIDLKEFTYILNAYKKAETLIDNINYDKENNEYVINNKDFDLVIKKSDEGIILKGEASNLNENNVKNLFSLLNLSSKLIPIKEDTISNLSSNNNIENLGNEVVNNSITNLNDVIENPQLFISDVNNLKEGSDNLDIGGFNFNINKENGININLGDVDKIVNKLNKED